MVERTFYDTCVFYLAQNHENHLQPACIGLLDANSIAWPVAYGELSLHEATIYEFLRAFVVACAHQGVDVLQVDIAEARRALKPLQGLKKNLRFLGFVGNDLLQAVAAKTAGCFSIVTNDADYWDPAAKARHGRPTTGPVFQLLRDEIGLHVEYPDEALQRLRTAANAP